MAEINRIAKGAREGRDGEGGRGDEMAVEAGIGGGERKEAGTGIGGESTWAVRVSCALEFSERFVRRDIALAGRVQAVRLLTGR